jgi:acetyl-CoA synthetase
MMSAGEAVGDAVFAYCREQLGVTVNEMFGQTEINYVVGNCARRRPGLAARARQHGQGLPRPPRGGDRRRRQGMRAGRAGRRGGEPLSTSTATRPDLLPRLLEEREPPAASSPATGAAPATWRTRDADGYLWYQGRADDVFKAAGYRIGPGEIENCLVKHPAVVPTRPWCPSPTPSAARW